MITKFLSTGPQKAQFLRYPKLLKSTFPISWTFWGEKLSGSVGRAQLSHVTTLSDSKESVRMRWLENTLTTLSLGVKWHNIVNFRDRTLYWQWKGFFNQYFVAFRLERRHGHSGYFPESQPYGHHHADWNSQWIDVPCGWVFFLIYSNLWRC